jgi:hypothetical protein
MNQEYLQSLVPQIMEYYGDQIEQQLDPIVRTQLQQLGITPTPVEKQKMQQHLKQTLLRAPIMEISQDHHAHLSHIMGMDPQYSRTPPRTNINFGPSALPPNTLQAKVFNSRDNPIEIMQLSAIMISAACDAYKKNHPSGDGTTDKK